MSDYLSLAKINHVDNVSPDISCELEGLRNRLEFIADAAFAKATGPGRSSHNFFDGLGGIVCDCRDQVEEMIERYYPK
ncbi:MAG: hypothetical protein JXK94_11980 [Deltaproteobacteria bacterium]|nr:hypothetical protein [Deltaproteobacteria bacterium]